MFVTDGESALSDALSDSFPSATHLRCSFYFRKNIEAELVSLGVKEHNNISSTVLEGKKEHFTRWVFWMPPAKICSMLFWLHCRNRELEGNKKSVGHRVSIIGCFIEPG